MNGMRLSDEVREWASAAGLEPELVLRVARSALEEDLAGGTDVTTEATVPADQMGSGDVRARQAGVIAGIPVAAAVFDLCLAGQGRVVVPEGDGRQVAPGGTVLAVAGPTRRLLTAERSALNLLCHLSGVATLTRGWVDAVAHTGAVIRDTRKTTPGLRELEKYAVRCGGGSNHRMGLTDAALIKDNHIRAAGGVAPALAAVRRREEGEKLQRDDQDQRGSGLVCEVECDTVQQAREALQGGARLLLLDNMSTGGIAEAVALAGAYGARTEASGGLTRTDAPAVAALGVDYLAVGALTHSAPALDLALDLH